MSSLKNIFRISANYRIVLGLVSLTVSSVLVAGLLGLVPNVSQYQQKSRASFCESTAVSFMALAPRMDEEEMGAFLETLLKRNPDVESIGICQLGEGVVVSAGPHAQKWQSPPDVSHSENEFVVPISGGEERWGSLQIRFHESGWTALARPELILAGFIAISLFFGFTLYLRKVLSHMNPSRVIPTRVREALDALAEGLLVLDRESRIVLVNKALADAMNRDDSEFVGSKVDRLGLVPVDRSDPVIPWQETMQSGEPVRGVLMAVANGDGKTFSVSAVPILDERKVQRGAVVSLEDVTPLERKQAELKDALSSLKQSTEEIRAQNRELEWMATRDALTSCLNRRSFFKLFDEYWNEDIPERAGMAAVMVDIDHFKSINDTFGHAMGDQVLRDVAALLNEQISDVGLVCRYGGEEFAILLPQHDVDAAELRAERLRLGIRQLEFPQLKITASLGVSARSAETELPQDLLDEADKCLYVAKRNGRNQVVRWDRARSEAEEFEKSQKQPTPEDRQRKVANNGKAQATIPFHAVSALVTALSYRDHGTAAHSRRVADLCVGTAEGLLSLRDCYTLEIAALLHDIGKIGIPDSVLLKAGPLSEEEWRIMRRHRQIGLELVRSSFGARQLTEILECYSTWFDGSNSSSGGKPPVAARVLAIADAYDSMTTNVVYRNRKSTTEAITELRRCAGTQFDPELVERFITAVRVQQQESTGPVSMDKDVAMSIGVQIERLVTALDEQNMDELLDLTEGLLSTAEQNNAHDLKQVAQELQSCLSDDHDLIEVMQIAGEMLDLCRSTQSLLIKRENQRLESTSVSG